MKSAIVAALLLPALLAAPASAEELLDGSKIDDILAIAQKYGPATLEQQQNGNPRISATTEGVSYQIFFMNCAANAVCEDLNFYAGFKDIKPAMDALNTWNRDKRFGSAYLDADLDAAIEYDVNLEYGVSRKNLDAAFGVWSLLLGEFAAYIGYKPQAE